MELPPETEVCRYTYHVIADYEGNLRVKGHMQAADTWITPLVERRLLDFFSELQTLLEKTFMEPQNNDVDSDTH